MITKAWNTGRQYSARGQVIVATLHNDGAITFADHSRMIYGEIPASELHCAENMEKMTMRAYDNYNYSSSRRASNDGMFQAGCNAEK